MSDDPGDNLFLRLFTFLIRCLQHLPLTTLLLLGAAGLFAARVWIPLFDETIGRGPYFPGHLQLLEVPSQPEIRGFFRLWDGEWWRILVATLHHGSLVHLLFNAFFIWTCAALLERRLGIIVYAIFLFSAALASSLLEIWAESPFLGLSGVGYALFGALLMLRRSDPEVEEAVPSSFVLFGLGWLFFCLPLTWAHIVSIANGAHLGGFIYGTVVGWLLFSVGRHHRFVAMVMLALTHGVLCLLVALAVHPLKHGAYFARKAYYAQPVMGPQVISLCERATRFDPRQVWAWKIQIAAALQKDDIPRAWLLCLQAMKANRHEESLVELAREFWEGMASNSVREQAKQQFEQTFDGELKAWQLRVFGEVRVDVEIDEDLPTKTLHLDLNVDTDLFDFRRSGQPSSRQELNPQHPDSAREVREATSLDG